MIERTSRALRNKVLIVDDELNEATAWGRASRALVVELENRYMDAVQALSPADGEAVVTSDAAINAVLVDWTFASDDPQTHAQVRTLLEKIRYRNARLPVFLMAERGEASSIPIDVLQLANEFVWTMEDTASFIAGRVLAAVHHYRSHLLGPMASALFRFAETYEYSWHSPGHTGGTAFLKSPAGRAFYDHFGENLFRSDLSISVSELGSLFDHSGPIGESEKYAAHVFGAHRSYCVTNGSSTSNRIVLTASVARGDIVGCDRNCHKSIEHGLMMTGGIPVYLMPSRNRYGILGPIYPERLRSDAIEQSIQDNPLCRDVSDNRLAQCIITNSTYDGLCAKVPRICELLGDSVDRIHFDEAWYAYARFNPLYRDRFAMSGDPALYDGPTLTASQSTHKVLAALSQASFLHVRQGRRPLEHQRLNEAFMMHSSTSPLYTIIASNDIATSMMDGPAGLALTTECIQEAIDFRQMIGRIAKQFASQGDWFFETWNPDTVRDQKTGTEYPFESAPEELLVSEPSCWVLHPGDEWHGFDALPEDFAMLDPVKVSVITPGIQRSGEMASWGIPARLVSVYLQTHGIQVEKTSDYTLLLLFTLGITKGKWGTLVNSLLEFKKDYAANVPLDRVLPDLVAAHPRRYGNLGLLELGTAMHNLLRDQERVRLLHQAFQHLPEAALTPADAYQRVLHDGAELVNLADMAHRTVATGVIPYPPGIPLLMPGERTGAPDGPFLSYLRAIHSWDAAFPGFSHETHGVHRTEQGGYQVSCLIDRV